MVFAAYLLENAILVLSWGGAFAPYFSLYRRFLYERPAPPGVHLQLFQNKMTNAQQMSRGGLELTEPSNMAISTVKFPQVCESNTRKLLSGSELYHTFAH